MLGCERARKMGFRGDGPSGKTDGRESRTLEEDSTWQARSTIMIGMADTVPPTRRSEIMSGIRSKGMKPEMTVRRLLHSMGYRYRLHRRELPGKPDLVFPARRKIIFVHGCFWHQHVDPGCRIVRRPKSNREYWLPKLARNVARDAENQARLEELGWGVLVIWECEVRAGSCFLARATEFLEGR